MATQNKTACRWGTAIRFQPPTDSTFQIHTPTAAEQSSQFERRPSWGSVRWQFWGWPSTTGTPCYRAPVLSAFPPGWRDALGGAGSPCDHGGLRKALLISVWDSGNGWHGAASGPMISLLWEACRAERGTPPEIVTSQARGTAPFPITRVPHLSATFPAKP